MTPLTQPKKPRRRHGCKTPSKNALRAHKKNCAEYEMILNFKKSIYKMITRGIPSYPADLLNTLVTVTPL